jgi:hypothetical protein
MATMGGARGRERRKLLPGAGPDAAICMSAGRNRMGLTATNELSQLTHVDRIYVSLVRRSGISGTARPSGLANSR